MLAVVQQDEFGTTVRFERRLKHSVEKVWSYLTDNDKLTQWFSELKVEDLRQGGRITFDMQDGTFEEFEITDYRELSVWSIRGERTGCVLSCIPRPKAVVWY